MCCDVLGILRPVNATRVPAKGNQLPVLPLKSSCKKKFCLEFVLRPDVYRVMPAF